MIFSPFLIIAVDQSGRFSREDYSHEAEMGLTFVGQKWFKREDGKHHAVDNPHYQQVMVGQDITDGDDIRHSLAYVAVAVGDGPVYANLTEQDRQSVLDVWKTMLEYHNAGHDVTSPGGGMR